jgi:hypothetical protein
VGHQRPRFPPWKSMVKTVPLCSSLLLVHLTSIEIRAAHEIVAPWAGQLAFLVVEFVAATRAPPPVFAFDFI